MGLMIEDVETITFIFTFPTRQVKDRVFENKPWNFKGFHMVLKNWPPGLSIHEASLKTSIFSMQVHGLPLEMFTIPNAAKIGNILGKLMGGYIHCCIERYMWIRVEINIENPLPEGFDLNRPGRMPKKKFSSSMKGFPTYAMDVVV